MAIGFVNSSVATSGGGPISGGGSMDTSGANFIVVLVSEFGSTASVVSDNKGNGNYTNLAKFGEASGYNCHIAYKYNASVGAGHTFSTDQSNFPVIVVMAFSGVQSASDPYDATAGTSGAGTADAGATAVASALTATTASSLYFTGFSNSQTGVGSHVTGTGATFIEPTNYDGGNALEGAAAYVVSSASVSASWTHAASGARGATMAIFAPAGAGGGGGAVVMVPSLPMVGIQ